MDLNLWDDSVDCQARLEKLVEALRAIDRPVLGRLLLRVGALPLQEYAERLHAHAPDCEMEPALRDAFTRHFAAIGCGDKATHAAVDALAGRRVLQTMTHVALTDGPTFLAAHHLGSLGLPTEQLYLVGACSGVAFSNISRPGCLTYHRLGIDDLVEPGSRPWIKWWWPHPPHAGEPGEHRLSMIAVSQGKALVFGAHISAATVERMAALRRPVRELLSVPQVGDSFAAWAGRAHGRILERALKRPVLSFDLNAVVSDYLQAVLADGTHPLHRVLFTASGRTRILNAVAQAPLFLTTLDARRREVDPFHFSGDALLGRRRRIELCPDSILEGLRTGELCPGTFITFAALAFINGFSCFGGVDQIEYLAHFAAVWAADPTLPQPVPGSIDALTSGRLVDEAGDDVFSLDLAYGVPYRAPCQGSMLAFLSPQLVRLLQRPFKWRRP